MIDSSVSSMSTIKAKVNIYNGDTLVKSCTCSDVLSDFKITRVGDTSKFFGFGIPHKLSVTFIDLERELSISLDNTIEVQLGDGVTFDNPYPTFYISEVNRDEKTNTINVTAHDLLYTTTQHTISELNIKPPYTPNSLAARIAGEMGIPIAALNILDDSYSTVYEKGGNFDGTETFKEVLDAVAEVTQSIYFIHSSNTLYFRRLNSNVALTITKNDYYELNTQSPRTLAAICSATELGDNLTATSTYRGVTQYVRDNPLWVYHDDRATLLDKAIENVGGLTIAQFYCDWTGDYRLEIGDRIKLVTTSDESVESYLLNDTIEYSGFLYEITEWEYSADEDETASNPTNIGDKINQTFAKVDKIEKNITLYVGDVVEKVLDEAIGDSLVEVTTKLAQLELDTQGIYADVSEIKEVDDTQNTKLGQLEIAANSVTTRVSSIETKTDNSIEALNNRVTSIAEESALKVDSKGVEIIVQQSLSDGVEKVVTSSKKYTFDDNGLDISSNSSNISTTITEDGMRIFRAGEEVLTADNEGVKAEDLHATTYLIIGETSRLEDRANRTACFWIGGN